MITLEQAYTTAFFLLPAIAISQVFPQRVAHTVQGCDANRVILHQGVASSVEGATKHDYTNALQHSTLSSNPIAVQIAGEPFIRDNIVTGKNQMSLFAQLFDFRPSRKSVHLYSDYYDDENEKSETVNLGQRSISLVRSRCLLIALIT